MKIEKLIEPWHGFAHRHIPEGNNVLNFKYCGLSNENRWNCSNEPTLYLASSKQVAMGEYSRHYKENRSSPLIKEVKKRSFWKLEIQLNRTINLCNESVYTSFPNTPESFKNIKNARTIAALLRNMYKVEAIFVPSLAFFDDFSKWCLVLFFENISQEVNEYIINVEQNGHLEIS